MAFEDGILQLVRSIQQFYREQGRHHLPWRKIHDPYAILVSEMMLQQTQVDRVIPFYTKFLDRFPTPAALARAPLSDVLRLWQGLGYNRRAQYLQRAAKALVDEYDGVFPQTLDAIEQLPGVGSYTAGAIMAFAFNQPAICIETNIRSVFRHFCAGDTDVIPDRVMRPLVAQALAQSTLSPREFYAALMDYGTYLKKQGIKKRAVSRPTVAFKGSTRQLRGAIVRELLVTPKTVSQLVRRVSRTNEEVLGVLLSLEKEGLLRRKGARYYPGS